jgi:hypothetical protein
MTIRLLPLILLVVSASGQVYSPSVLKAGQPDPTDLESFTQGIYHKANANTPRERAEAIWRFFLTDGRFVAPGFWYHIAGWAYEEPAGEVLDPMKLLNSYGFGLCYHIAPLLEAVFEAGGFTDARVWFLTGHTVAEVFYDGSYHYFDSDMMGYNVAGNGPFRGKPVASVRDIERNPEILLGKLESPTVVRKGEVDEPWYPADVREAAIDGLASLFTSTNDNYLFRHTRYSRGHDMSFVLRRGEKVTRYFGPEEPGLFYLPYAFDGEHWQEFPKEIASYRIRTPDGPRSQKDDRLWATGRIEYSPPAIPTDRVLIYDMPSPWVIIDASMRMRLDLPSSDSSISIETSVDGEHWDQASELQGPFQGEWKVEPRVITKTTNGRLTAVSGTYGYKVRINRRGPVTAPIEALTFVTRFQVNPRTLPALATGENRMTWTSPQATYRKRIPVSLKRIRTEGFQYVEENGQEFLLPRETEGEAIIAISAEGRPLTGLQAGARFLELRDGLAPDKLTAETRRTSFTTRRGGAWIEWSLSPEGPWTPLWAFDANPEWLDGEKIGRTLIWPEAFAATDNLPQGTTTAFVRFRSNGSAVDGIRLAAVARGDPPSGLVRITHRWTENGVEREHREEVDATLRQKQYRILAGSGVRNESITYEMVP